MIATHLTRVCSQHTTFCMGTLRMHRGAHLLVTLTTLLSYLSCAVLPVFEITWRTTRHPHPLEQILVVGWIGVSPHRFPPPSLKGCLFEKAHPLYTLGTLFLCLCDLRIRCTRIHSLCAFASTPVLFLFILGERTGSLLGFISLSLSDFYILKFSHPSYS